MGYLERGLVRLAEFQERHVVPILVVVILFTSFMAVGATMVKLETDFNKELPQDLPIIALNNRISQKFSGQDVTLIAVTLDDKSYLKSSVEDIRDPRVITYLKNLGDALGQEPTILNTFSLGTVLGDVPFSSAAQVGDAISSSPELSGLVSGDFRTTVMIIQSDVGSSDSRIKELTQAIQENVDEVATPPGIRAVVTGSPQIQVLVFDLLGEDAVNTLIVAAVVIFVLLFAIQRSLTRGFVVFIPLALGVTWTWGTMGWAGIKLSIATAAIGAMILGLGVEYGAFMLTRYREERAKGDTQLDSLKVAVPAIGGAIIGSGTTTIVGFLALTLSVLPLLQRLGFSLAMGIAYSLAAAIIVQPIAILVQERAMRSYDKMRLRRAQRAMDKYKGAGT